MIFGSKRELIGSYVFAQSSNVAEPLFRYESLMADSNKYTKKMGKVIWSFH